MSSRITPGWVAAQAQALDGAPPEELLRWTAAAFGDRAGLTCSFGGGGLVLAHMAARVAPRLPVIFIDTDFLFPETVALKDDFVHRYGLHLVELHPQQTPAEQAGVHGDRLWERDPDLCCALRKVEPMERALQGLDAWITGLRQDQSAARAGVAPLEYHQLPDGRPLLKVLPLARWSRNQVWSYILEHGVPYNPLLDQGYKSIGCTHCTRPTADGEDERAGRWAGRGKTECGLHTFTRQAGLPGGEAEV